MKEATRYERAIAAKENSDALALVKQAGKTEVYALDAKEKEAWKQALLPVHREFESTIGRDLIQSIYAVAAQVEQERSKR